MIHTDKARNTWMTAAAEDIRTAYKHIKTELFTLQLYFIIGIISYHEYMY